MIMKSMLMSWVLLASSSAFAYFGEVSSTLHGEGRWSNAQGQTGEFDVSVSMIRESADVVAFEENFLFGEEGKTHSFKLFKKGKKTFDVMVADAKVGEGYCVDDLHKLYNFCHMEYNFEGHKGEHTANINTLTGKVRRIGSCNENENKIVWSDKLVPAR